MGISNTRQKDETLLYSSERCALLKKAVALPTYLPGMLALLACNGTIFGPVFYYPGQISNYNLSRVFECDNAQLSVACGHCMFCFFFLPETFCIIKRAYFKNCLKPTRAYFLLGKILRANSLILLTCRAVFKARKQISVSNCQCS